MDVSENGIHKNYWPMIPPAVEVSTPPAPNVNNTISLTNPSYSSNVIYIIPLIDNKSTKVTNWTDEHEQTDERCSIYRAYLKNQ